MLTGGIQDKLYTVVSIWWSHIPHVFSRKIYGRIHNLNIIFSYLPREMTFYINPCNFIITKPSLSTYLSHTPNKVSSSNKVSPWESGCEEEWRFCSLRISWESQVRRARGLGEELTSKKRGCLDKKGMQGQREYARTKRGHRFFPWSSSTIATFKSFCEGAGSCKAC